MKNGDDKAHELIKKQTEGLVTAMGAEADVLIDVGYPFVDNDPAFTEVAWQLANEYWGKENVQETELRMGAEDFGYYTHVVPGCFLSVWGSVMKKKELFTTCILLHLILMKELLQMVSK